MGENFYVVELQADFGDLKVVFETNRKLKDIHEVTEVALKNLQRSTDIKLTGLLNKEIECMLIRGETIK